MFIKKLTNQVICDPDNPVVETANGKLRGLIVDGTYIFRGVKYADAKRFQMPEKVQPWEGTRDAIIYGTVCPEIQTVQPHDNYNVPHVFYPQDEDCQYLNVWTQQLDAKAKKPVVVWLHGGGFSTGSGIEHFAYDGENMSRYGDLVVVTLNHRLNVLGYLDLSAYGEKYKYSGNVGMADIVAALEWVHDNIAAFGGDPDNVTIFGQSGGGGKVAALLQMPAADGLFHRAIIQSGIGKERPRPPVDPNSKTPAAKLLEALNIAPENVEELETVPYYQMAKAIMGMGRGAAMAFGPHDDGDYYMGSAFSKGIREHAKQIPVMVCTVLGEFTNNFNQTIDDGRKNTWSDAKRKAIVREKLGDAADAAIAAFQKAYPEKNIVDLLFVDTMFREGALAYVKQRAENGCVPTYNCIFTLESELYGGTLPWHNAEIPYVFHNADYLEPSYIPGVTEWLQEIVCNAWANFARNGDPNGVGIPHWDAVTPDCAATMIFDRQVRMGYNHDADLLQILDEHPFRMKPVSRSVAAKHFGGGPRV